MSADPVMRAVMLGNGPLLKDCATLWRSLGHGLEAVVTQTPEIQHWAEAEGLRVVSAHEDLQKALDGVGFHWLLSIANQDILPQSLLDLPTRGAVHCHDGPLPQYAGLNAPIWARLKQEPRHGITWHRMTAQAAAGDILAQRLFDIDSGDTAQSLHAKCSAAAIESFPELATALQAGLPDAQAQDLSQRSYFARTDRPEAGGRIDFTKESKEVVALIRAMDHGDQYNPLWAAKLAAVDRLLLVNAAEAAANPSNAAAGTVLSFDSATLTVACGRGAVTLSRITDLDGIEMDLTTVLNGEEILPSLDAEAQAGWTKRMRAVAQAEPLWRARLAAFLPADLPLSGDGADSAKMQNLPLTLPKTSPQSVLTAVGIWALRSGLSSELSQSCDIAYRGPRLTATALLVPWVPLRLSEEMLHGSVSEAGAQMGASAAEADQNGGFARDLIARDPALSPLQVPDVAVHMGGAAIEGAAVTVAIHGNSAMLYFDPAKVDAAQAQRMVARLETVATHLTTAKMVSEIGLMSEADHKELPPHGTAEEATIDPDLTIVAQFEAKAAQTPDAPALIFGADRLSYTELNTRANQLAHVLRDMGVERGTIVGLYLHRAPNLLVAALGILKAGAAYLPMDPTHPTARLAHCVKDSGCQVIITQAALSRALPGSQAEIFEIDTDERLSGAESRNPALSARGDDLAYLIYTSGSTGLPKGVMVTHGNLANTCAGLDARIPHQAGDTWVALNALSFDLSVLDLFWPLTRGMKLLLTDDEITTQLNNGHLPSPPKDIALSLYHAGTADAPENTSYDLLLQSAAFADANGFRAIWTADSALESFGGPLPNAAMLSAALASVTHKIDVRGGAYPSTEQDAAQLATDWAVIDTLTKGRAGLAIASGPPQDHAPLDSLRALPLWLTAATAPQSWAEAGRNGCHVLTHLLGQTADDLGQNIAPYHTALREAGHDPKDFDITLMLHSYLAADPESAHNTARAPMTAYLRRTPDLLRHYALDCPALEQPDPNHLSDTEFDTLLEHACQRCLEESGLIGTVESALAHVTRLKQLGVTEIACLVDFGIPPERVLEGLAPLADVLRRANAEPRAADEDMSLSTQIERHGVSHLHITPSMARALMENDETRRALAGVKHLLLCGEPLSGALVAELQAATTAQIQNMYGPTETTIWSTTAPATAPTTAQDSIATIGTPIANTEIYVVDKAGAPVPVDVPGELWIGGAGVARGYWQQPERTAERFIDSPFGTGRLYKTGDLVRWRSDGALDFVGRMDHQIKLRGHRIELGEIEARLEEITGIAQAVVLAREDTPGDRRLVAYLRGDIPAETEITAHLSALLPPIMLPQHYVTLPRFPLTPHNKVDRKALPPPEITTQPTPAPAPADAADATQHIDSAMVGLIQEVWGDVLGVSNIKTYDNFFDLGGQALLAVRAHEAIRDRSGVMQLAVSDIFQFPTVETLATRLQALKDSPEPEIAAEQDSDETLSLESMSRADIMRKRREMRARRQAAK